MAREPDVALLMIAPGTVSKKNLNRHFYKKPLLLTSYRSSILQGDRVLMKYLGILPHGNQIPCKWHQGDAINKTV